VTRREHAEKAEGESERKKQRGGRARRPWGSEVAALRFCFSVGAAESDDVLGAEAGEVKVLGV